VVYAVLWDWRIKMEYTQEQIDEIVASSKKGLFSESDLNRKVDSEVDRRVNSGIEKGLETNRIKWEEDFKKKQTMTAEEIVSKQLRDEKDALSIKEKEINKKSNRIEAKDMLSGAGVPKSQYDKVIEMMVNDDIDVTKNNVQTFIDTFLSIKTDIETKIKSESSKIPAPNQGKNEPITKSDFNKMGFAEKVNFKKTNPETYKEFMN